MLTPSQKSKAETQQYRLVGNHSAAKICFWTKECIRKHDKVCYKELFYDIHCGKCLEMSPAILCNQRCLHCWRDTSLFAPKWDGKVDEPKEIIQKCIEERRKLLIGFGGHEIVKQKDLKEHFENCLIPDHAAISLTGEPTLYPKLPQLIDSFFDDFNFRTVFLVTNGTCPEMLKKIGTESKHFPTNLYLSLEAYSYEGHLRFNHPTSRNLWNKVQQSMKYLAKIKNKTRTILRITAIKGFNMGQSKDFLQFIELMKPSFIEIKGYAFLGCSRRRLKEENVPSWKEVLRFAQEITRMSNYKITHQHEASMVVQLSEN